MTFHTTTMDLEQNNQDTIQVIQSFHSTVAVSPNSGAQKYLKS